MTHSPRFLKKRITQAVASLTRGRPWALAGCGGNLCWSALLSACISWGRALYFLCHPRTFFSFCHVRPWAGHLPYRFPGQAGEWRKRKKAGEWRKRKKAEEWRKRKKAGNDNKKRRTGNDRRKRKYEHGGRKNKPGVCKRSGEKCKAKGLLSLIRGFLWECRYCWRRGPEIPCPAAAVCG